MQCLHCKKEISTVDKPGRREECPHCGGDLHICRHCKFYDRAAYNECLETQADRVVEKDRSNFCDYFQWADSLIQKDISTDDAKKKLEGLFKT